MLRCAGHQRKYQIQIYVPGGCLKTRETKPIANGLVLPAGFLVEAAGVEPASENVTGQEPTYLVAFTRRELPRHIRFLRLEPTRNASR